jgi:alpha-N-acetylglucosamine transferase
MTGFYDLLNKLKVHFDSDPIVNSVTQGDIFQVDLNKQTIFPLTHIMVNSSTLGDNTMSFNVSILAMDIVDISKSEVVDIFQENNNELDVLNTQHAVLNRAYQKMLHGNLWDDKYVIETDPTLEPFTERFENLLAGWTMTFDVVVPNEMTIC